MLHPSDIAESTSLGRLMIFTSRDWCARESLVLGGFFYFIELCSSLEPAPAILLLAAEALTLRLSSVRKLGLRFRETSKALS